MVSFPELPTELPYGFLKEITNDFSDERKISGSLFGILYKGTVPDEGRVMAVKKLQENTAMPADKTFIKVVSNIMALKHQNIVEITGYCSERSKSLVLIDKRFIQRGIDEYFICYEYLPHGSLRKNLFGTEAIRFLSLKEDWNTRFEIIMGICLGLRFLHKLDNPIIHMDIKPENIQLDANMVPKITDFELSRVIDQEQTKLYTQTVVGSYGYMAPEYLYRGEISAMSDIYSLGLTIIEITTKEQNCPEIEQPSGRKFIEKVQNTWKQRHIEFKYSSLHSEGLRQVEQCIEIALECVHIDQKLRPTIENIVDRLGRVS